MRWGRLCAGAGALVFLSAATCEVDPVPELTFAGTLSVKGTVTGTAEKGKYMRGGVERETSAAALKTAQEHATHYDGPTTFDVVYNITLKADKTVDATKSTVQFKKVLFSHNGTLSKTVWETLVVPVTRVTLDASDNLESFELAGPTWYKDIPGSITDAGITGSVNVTTTATRYVGKYKSNSNGALYTYDVVSAPAAPCPPDEDAGPDDGGIGPDASDEDAGPPDAGPPDAGPQDAGPQDAGPQDAGPQDAGPQDAGPQDAGPQDAGPGDGGPQDAGLGCDGGVGALACEVLERAAAVCPPPDPEPSPIPPDHDIFEPMNPDPEQP